jgi:hypothetical protein
VGSWSVRPAVQRSSEPAGIVNPEKESRDQATRKQATKDGDAEDSHLTPSGRALLVREKQFADVTQHNANIYSKHPPEGKQHCDRGAPDFSRARSLGGARQLSCQAPA